METAKRDLARLIFAAIAAAGCGLAQGPAPAPAKAQEKHVRDFRAEQPQASIYASAVCQAARTDGYRRSSNLHRVDDATLEPDLSSLMAKSDEVILGSTMRGNISVLSPSGEYAVEYIDVKVLRTWKGSHQVGDTVTFGLPDADVLCASRGANAAGISPEGNVVSPWWNGRQPGFGTFTAGGDWGGFHSGPLLLFLRHSQGSEAQHIEGLRLTGGDGVEGMFDFSPLRVTSAEFHACRGDSVRDVATCNEVLSADDLPVSLPYHRGPLFEKYNGTPTFAFLQEVQSVAASLGYAEKSAPSK